MAKQIKILMFGDVVGELGCATFQKHAPKLKKQFDADFMIVNGENSCATGRGISPKLVAFFKHNGADLVTSGNHIWASKEIVDHFEQQNVDLLRPANFPSECPGKGVALLAKDGVTIAVINLQGRVFMKELLDCPFKAADSLMSYLKNKADWIFTPRLARKKWVLHIIWTDVLQLLLAPTLMCKLPMSASCLAEPLLLRI